MKNLKTPGNALYLTYVFFLMVQIPIYSQDLDKVWQRFRPEIDKIQNDVDAVELFRTKIKDEFELTDGLMLFLVDLNKGTFAKQIEFLMTVPVEKWNPSAGADGWTSVDLKTVQRLVEKNSTTAFDNVYNYFKVISKEFKGISLLSSMIEAYNGNDRGKLKSIFEASEQVVAWISSDLPNIGTAWLCAGFVNYAFEKFVNTTLTEHEEYWWNKYSGYLLEEYPNTIQDWALPSTKGDPEAFFDSRLSEFWDLAEEFEQGAPQGFKRSLDARNRFGPSFAARYYKDYLHESFLTWARRNAEIEKDNAWTEAERNARELKQLIDELKILQAAIEAADMQMKEKPPRPRNLGIMPNKIDLKVGETVQFAAIALYDDDQYRDVTELATTIWSSGTNSYTATEILEATGQTVIINVTHMNLTASAIINVIGKKSEDENPCEGENQEWNEEKNKCDCVEGYEMIEELGKCVSIDEAIKVVSGEKSETACDEVSMAGRLARLQEISAVSQLKVAEFYNLLDHFEKAVNEGNRNPCEDMIIVTTFSGAIWMEQEFKDYQKEAIQLSSELIFEAAMCGLNDPRFEAKSIIGIVGKLGPPVGIVERGVSEMESELNTRGCDRQEVVNRGNSIAETPANPEVVGGLEAGGIIQPPNQIPGGTMGVIGVTYDGTNAPQSSVNVSVNLPFKTFNYAMGNGSYELSNFENAQLKEGDRMQITVYGTSLNPTIVLIPDDFLWIDPETQQQTSPGNGRCVFTVIISIYYNDDEDVNRYEMIVSIGTSGFEIPGFPEGFGRVLSF